MSKDESRIPYTRYHVIPNNDLKCLDNGEYRVYSELCRRRNWHLDNPITFETTVQYLSEQCNMHRGTIHKHIATLKEKGIITIAKQMGPVGNKYFLPELNPVDKDGNPLLSPIDDNTVAHERPSVVPARQPVVYGRQQQPSNSHHNRVSGHPQEYIKEYIKDKKTILTNEEKMQRRRDEAYISEEQAALNRDNIKRLTDAVTGELT